MCQGRNRTRRSRVSPAAQIEPLLDRKPSQLSGGQRQRVAIGRALVRDPLLFLFDEPLSNLDAKLRVEMRMEIKQLHQRIGATIVYVTHDQIEAMTMATRIAVMRQGEVQQFADPETVYNCPANLFVARFMGSPPMNTLSARLEATSGGTVAVIGHGEAATGSPRHQGRKTGLAERSYWAFGQNASPSRRGISVTRQVPPSRIVAPVEMIEPTGAETIV